MILPGYHRGLPKTQGCIERTERVSFIQVGFDGVRVAFPLQDIDRVLRAVAVAPVPGASACVLGLVNVAGEAVPTYDMRTLLGLPRRQVQPADRMVLTKGRGRFAFMADSVLGVVDAEAAVPSCAFSLGAAGVRGVARTAGDLVVVHDLKRFMALERAIALRQHA